MTKLELEEKRQEIKTSVRAAYKEGRLDDMQALKRQMEEIDGILRFGFDRDGNELVMEFKDFPALTGSDKQVKWAEDIRSRFYADINRVMKECVARNDVNNFGGFRQRGEENLRQTSASWWIDNRMFLSVRY